MLEEDEGRRLGRMQAIKDKMHEREEMRKVKAEAKEEEKVQIRDKCRYTYIYCFLLFVLF